MNKRRKRQEINSWVIQCQDQAVLSAWRSFEDGKNKKQWGEKRGMHARKKGLEEQRAKGT